MRVLLLGSLLLAMACGGAGLGLSPRPGAAGPHPATLGPDPCTDLAGGARACRRLAGGAFILGSNGELARYDAGGAFTGAILAGLASLTVAGPYVCGLDASRALRCFRDDHGDRTCPAAVFAPELLPVALVERGPPAVALRGSARLALLGIHSSAGETRVVRLAGSCAQHCVRLGCGAATHCVDPCEAGHGPRLEAAPV